jgi:thymidylate synthase (FAD)
VELIGVYGSDELHALSAWTSTSRELTDEKRARIGPLLRKLASEGHHTPYERSSLHFLVTCEQASHIHLLKHRIGVSINAESARYKELKGDKAYTPGDWPASEQAEIDAHNELCFDRYHLCLERLTPVLGRRRAKESARYYLPYASQIQMDVMFNFRSFMHFQKLRNEEHAQLEIREIAGAMLDLVIGTGVFPLSLEAFGI